MDGVIAPVIFISGGISSHDSVFNACTIFVFAQIASTEFVGNTFNNALVQVFGGQQLIIRDNVFSNNLDHPLFREFLPEAVGPFGQPLQNSRFFLSQLSLFVGNAVVENNLFENTQDIMDDEVEIKSSALNISGVNIAINENRFVNFDRVALIDSRSAGVSLDINGNEFENNEVVFGFDPFLRAPVTLNLNNNKVSDSVCLFSILSEREFVVIQGEANQLSNIENLSCPNEIELPEGFVVMPDSEAE